MRLTFDEMERGDPDTLRREAKQLFDSVQQNPSWGGSPTYLLQAQMYLAEIVRRDDERIAKRDYRIERAIMWLIIGEIALSLVGIRLEILGQRDQLQALQSIERAIVQNGSRK